MRRVVLDSNAVDPLIDIPGATKRSERGRWRPTRCALHTSDRGRAAATRDPDRRSHLLSAIRDLGRLVPTGAFALDVSRLGLARLSNDIEAVEALRSSSVTHTRDALIAASAAYENCALVTNEVRRLPARVRARHRGNDKRADLVAWVGFDDAA